MTPDQMAELAARLRLRAKLFREAEPGSVIAGDMIRAADLIESMAKRVPLSDQEIMNLVRGHCAAMRWPSTALDIARAIEQAHGIRSEE